jgi:hypothetical protein
MDAQAWALLLAVIGLGLGIVSRGRRQRDSPGSGGLYLALILLPIAIIIGLLPRMLHLGEALQIAASVVSIILSLSAMALLIVGAVRKLKA